MGVTNRTLLRVFGLRRSGNHAVIGWIMENTPGTKLHLNNIGDNLANPYRAFATGVISGPQLGQVFRRRKLLRMLHWHGEKLADKKFYNSAREVDFKSLKVLPKDLLLLSYEDIDPRSPFIQEFLAAPDKHVGGSDRIMTALILRDPFNQFASLMKKGFLNRATSGFYVERWKQYAREFVGESSCLGRDLVAVNYNRWVQEAEYRRELATRLGLVTGDDSFQQVPLFGDGSSFQTGATSAEQLDVFDRWRQYMGQPEYDCLFDHEIIELAARVFESALSNDFRCALK